MVKDGEKMEKRWRKNEKKSYTINITYDTGDSFHTENGVEGTINLSWRNLKKAQQALHDIQMHHACYMIMDRDYNVGKKEKEKAMKVVKSSSWYCSDSWQYSILLENDDGVRVFSLVSFL